MIIEKDALKTIKGEIFIILQQGLLWCSSIHHGEWRKGL